MTFRSDPAAKLTALLDTLERDLLRAPPDEVRDAQRETGRAWETSCQEVRDLLWRAMAARNDDGIAGPLGTGRLGDTLARH